MKSLAQTYSIKAPIAKVWDALVNPKTIDAWGGGPAKMNEEEGFEFKLWGGDIKGVNTKVIKEKELHQDWMSGNWDKYSRLVFKLTFANGITTVRLTKSDIPDSDYDDIADGWKTYYMGEIKRLLEK